MFLSVIGGDLSTYVPAPLICFNTMLKGLNSTYMVLLIAASIDVYIVVLGR